MEKIVNRFAFEGDVISISPHGNGHINKTYLVSTSKRRYILQRVNLHVFPDIDMLMNNIEIVTTHLREKGVATLEIVKTKDGGLYLKEGEEAIRSFAFVEDSVCYEALPSLEMVEEAGKGFGLFHQGLSDLDPNLLGEVIPGFHNTVSRYDFFLHQVEENASKRLNTCLDEVEFLTSEKGNYGLIVDAIKEKRIPEGISHNDPKINNVAFSKTSGKLICVLDLDTVMPGSFLFDFGDGLRSLFTGDNEDSLDLSKLRVDLPLYEAYLRGYYGMMRGHINEEEKRLLPKSILIITEELAMRFLGDYIAGDQYFGVSYPEHNLVRAKTQIALAKDILARMDELGEITKRVCR